ncbi:FAD-dependent oxidoreductase [Tomitella gaofuii]|uniref:FAD-dependent oxidoreductase n=1 Tax=Tomitella gaofuii TaxID=2760083 RepID=UPI0015FA58B0|nr:FAD-dependent oxidoreductase [Tomitella gaofuii]
MAAGAEAGGYDVVVVGAGAAGAAAALSAHQAGARVLVLEKGNADSAGGNTRVSGGGWFTHDDPERAAVFLRTLCGPYGLDEEVIRAWAAETAVNSQWMRSLGAPVARSGEYHTSPEYLGVDGADCYTGMDTVDGRMGDGALLAFLRGALADSGIEVREAAAARELLRDGAGRVEGVVLDDGTAIGARGVVLATGGFAANPQMVRDYLRVPDHVLWGSPYSTGDGHRMAQQAGADLWHMDNMMTITGVETGRRTGMYLALWGSPHYLFVSASGRRFADETAEARHGHVEHDGRYEHFPTHRFHVVFDHRLLSAGPLSPDRGVLPVGWELLENGTRWSADNSEEIADGRIAAADTPRALAEAIGVHPETLETTLQHYNAACAAGRDDWFGRDPETLGAVDRAPYYALEVVPMIGWSSGGPRRDGRSRVLDVRGEPIPGLFAAGEVSSTYSWCKDGGFHIADALAFGRIAGREAAALAEAAVC